MVRGMNTGSAFLLVRITVRKGCYHSLSQPEIVSDKEVYRYLELDLGPFSWGFQLHSATIL